MDTEPPRVLSTVDMTVFLVVCAAFFLHYLGVGLLPDGAEPWSETNQWLMWTAAVPTVAGAVAVPSLSLTAQRPGQDR
ncbi:hypothetical protein AB0J28_15150 [Streptosporangium canum]|uniref:hypothetical protein n=1 Tax=Streptosporangium canum TaxID=324952 RepID=UPI003427F136